MITLSNWTAKSRYLLHLILITLTILISIFFIALAKSDIVYPSSEKIKGKNIVLILADDLGWNDVGFHGSEIKTPNLDKLAESGIELNRFYVKSKCSPSRAAIMTGKHPSRIGMHGHVVQPWDKIGLPIEEKTIAETLKKAGYYTAMVGKWHLGQYSSADLPTKRGFDYYYGNYGGGVDYFKHTKFNGLDWHRNEKPVIEPGYTTDLIGQEAVNIIRNHKYSDSPLFLYVSFTAPHSPLQAKEEDLMHYGFIQNKGRQTYAAQVQAMDKAIGWIIQELKDRRIYDNTLVFFTSDNGGAAHNENTRGDNRLLRGQKGTLYEGGLRVPTLISYPANLENGQVSQLVFQGEDLYSTFAAFAGANVKSQELDGINILEALKNRTTGRQEIVLEYVNSSTFAFLKGDFKLVGNGLYAFFTPYHGMLELFDLNNDPYETKNLAIENPDKVSEMKSSIEDYEKYVVPTLVSNETKPDDFIYPKIWSPKFLSEFPRKQIRFVMGKFIIIPKFGIFLIAVIVGISIGYLFRYYSSKLKSR